MQKHFQENKAIILFTMAWFIINLIQAYFTEITEDEAYYWVYSQFPAWGYYDHPPMIAFLVKLGYSLFPNELGVRLIPSLLGAGTIYGIWHLIPEGSRNQRIFIWSIFAVTLMHLNVAGFLALPDIPLVFFTTLYFLVLKKYLHDDRMLQAILVGIIVALMMYSKYHTMLILFFTLVAEWKLLLRRSFWLIVAIAVILYLPHILWQYKHDFVSFQYHLISRNDPFQPRQILEYLGNQLLVTGPFVGVILLYLAFVRRATGSFERVLKFNFIGFFGFFLVSSVRGHVEPHWTAAAFPPLIVLAMMNIHEFPRLQKWLKILAVASIPLIMVIRIYLVWNILPLPMNVSRMFHEKDVWAAQIEDVAGDRPVVFMNKYQYPSLYWFYTKKKAFSRNTMFYRRNQYDVWPLESELEGNRVLLTRWGKTDSTNILTTIFGDVPYYEIDSYCSFNRLKIDILEKDPIAKTGETIFVPIRISNPTALEVSLDYDCDSNLSPMLMCTFVDEERGRQYFALDPQPELGSLEPKEEILLDVRINAPADPGKYSLIISFGSYLLYPGINGAPVELTVTSDLQ
ncbi:ArnT family glycosyltransferase [Bacteroidota bacterium]